MNLEDSLREALQHDAAELVPVGPGPDDARRRAFRRKRRVQGGVVTLSAAALVGGTLAAVSARPQGHDGGQVHAQPSATKAAPDLVWRSVAGTVGEDFAHFTTADGVTYALSTAPAGQPNNGNAMPTDLYATHDGVTWTRTSLGALAPADIAERGGVLYAVSTAPGATAGSTDYRLSTSSDGGAQWDAASLPVSFKRPAANVPLGFGTRLQVARGAHATVVLAEATYQPDLGSALRLADGEGYTFDATGVKVLSPCNVPATGAVTGVTAPPSEKVRCEPTVVATHPWSEFGVTDPAALHQQRVLVRDDGGDWQPVSLQPGGNTTVQDLTATAHGFLLVEQDWSGTNGPVSTLLASADGRSWGPVANPMPEAETFAASGDRVVAFDQRHGTVAASIDGGSTWGPVQQLASQLPSGTSGPVDWRVDVGPLGFAASATSGVGTSGQQRFALVSADGVTWKTTDLASAKAPASGYIVGLAVGADHVEVTFGFPQSDPTKPATIVTLVGTPKA